MCRFLLLVLAAFLAGCAENPPVEVPPQKKEPEPPKIISQPHKYMNGRSFKPQATQLLNIRSHCTHRDALGTRTCLDLQVKNGEVKRFSAEITIPKRGTCHFDLKNFTQKETLPQVILAAKDGTACTVRMWEQTTDKKRHQVTVAYSACRSACTGDTFDYLWPILVDAKTGRCF